MPPTLPTGIQLTPIDPAFRADPYPILAKLRAEEPIHRDRELDRIIFTRHDDVFAILRNSDYWSDPRKANPGTFTYEFLGGKEEHDPSMLLMDEPDHQRLRDLIRHPFAPRAVERWRERARAVAQRVIGALDEGEFDLIEKVAGPIPTVVIAELLGVDPDLHDQFKLWSDASIATAFTPASTPEEVEKSEAARVALDAFFHEQIELRRAKPGDDLISKMIRAEEAGDRLTTGEIVSQCSLLLLAGNLTTTDLIGNSVMALVSNPGELEKLRKHPDLMKNTVEEVLRYDSPVTNSGRISHCDHEIDGEKILKGESLSVSLAAANRDPAIYPDPDRFDIEREDVHHQSFGGGRHFCLGSHLAKLEAAETLSVLLEHFPTLGFGSDGHEYAANPSFRGLKSLSIAGGR